jgi:Plus-3 domain
MVEDKKRCTAALVRENIKLIYLRQDLVLQFLKNLDTFEQKIMGCFVRVKHHPKEFYGIPPNIYQIGQVTGKYNF